MGRTHPNLIKQQLCRVPECSGKCLTNHQLPSLSQLCPSHLQHKEKVLKHHQEWGFLRTLTCCASGAASIKFLYNTTDFVLLNIFSALLFTFYSWGHQDTRRLKMRPRAQRHFTAASLYQPQGFHRIWPLSQPPPKSQKTHPAVQEWQKNGLGMQCSRGKV